jgi:hypothetical protein
VQVVLRWLRINRRWLLIYDNIDDLTVAERFLPKAGTGHLLFTTRAHALDSLTQRLDLQQMDPEVGALLLLRRASRLALQATLNATSPDERRLAQTVSEELDGFTTSPRPGLLKVNYFFLQLAITLAEKVL